MNNIKWSFIFFLSILANLPGSAQSKKYDISAPTDLEQVGVNKVLCMSNGNTMLFHFELNKPIVVKVFDTLHKEIASKQNSSKLLDKLHFDLSIFKGLYDINGEAVLFIEQSPASKKQLIRIRYDAANGKVIEEKMIGEGESISHLMGFYVMKSKATDGYAILFSDDVQQFKECNVYVSFYNNKHEEVRKVSIPIDRKEYDYIEVKGAEADANGNCITISLLKEVTNSTNHNSGFSNSVATFDHVLLIAYIPTKASVARECKADVSTTFFPYFSDYTYNPFAGDLNMLLFSYKEFIANNGLDVVQKDYKSVLLFNIDPNDMSLKHSWMNNDMAIETYRRQTDTTKTYDGVPVKMFTNENGLSTIISQSYGRYDEIESHARRNAFNTFLGKIAITQCDDEGKEIWGTVLPFSQNYVSYKNYYSAHNLSKRSEEQHLFADHPPQVYDRQFLSFNAYTFNKNYYIIYNDYDKNFNNSIARPGDTVYSFANTNACYYKLNKKKEVTKSYLFGGPAANEYKCNFIEGADFDEQKGVYATLVQCKKEDGISLCMAWCQLD